MRRIETSRCSRRSLIAVVVAGAFSSLTGCLGDFPGSNDAATEGERTEKTFPEHPINEPTETPEGRVCDGPCGMTSSAFPEWNAQLTHEDGRGAFFDTPGCLVAYHHDPTFYGGLDVPIENVWVRDFESRELIDATTAYFVLEYETDRLSEPMAHNPKPFSDREGAIEYVDSYDDLDENDIVGLDDFGAEQANRYRDYPISDDS